MDSFKPMLVTALIFLPPCLHYSGLFSGSLMELWQIYLFGANKAGHMELFTGFVKFSCVWAAANYFLVLTLFA
jgi:hypothetical protein